MLPASVVLGGLPPRADLGLLLAVGLLAVARVHASVTPVPFLPALGVLAGYLAVRNRSAS